MCRSGGGGGGGGGITKRVRGSSRGMNTSMRRQWQMACYWDVATRGKYASCLRVQYAYTDRHAQGAGPVILGMRKTGSHVGKKKTTGRQAYSGRSAFPTWRICLSGCISLPLCTSPLPLSLPPSAITFFKLLYLSAHPWMWPSCKGH